MYYLKRVLGQFLTNLIHYKAYKNTMNTQLQNLLNGTKKVCLSMAANRAKKKVELNLKKVPTIWLDFINNFLG